MMVSDSDPNTTRGPVGFPGFASFDVLASRPRTGNSIGEGMRIERIIRIELIDRLATRVDLATGEGIEGELPREAKRPGPGQFPSFLALVRPRALRRWLDRPVSVRSVKSAYHTRGFAVS
jgi:hypothetical protein